jgi:hypothetical protein
MLAEHDRRRASGLADAYFRFLSSAYPVPNN